MKYAYQIAKIIYGCVIALSIGALSLSFDLSSALRTQKTLPMNDAVVLEYVSVIIIYADESRFLAGRFVPN